MSSCRFTKQRRPYLTKPYLDCGNRAGEWTTSPEPASVSTLQNESLMFARRTSKNAGQDAHAKTGSICMQMVIVSQINQRGAKTVWRPCHAFP